MVRFGPLKVSLVEAESKMPFPEHEKDGKVFVEVEPNVEYYICVERLEEKDKQVNINCQVDGERVKGIVFKEKIYHGFRYEENGMVFTRALKFGVPSSSSDAEATPSGMLMGTVSIEAYECGQVVDPPTPSNENTGDVPVVSPPKSKPGQQTFISSEPLNIDRDLAKKKCVRSELGEKKSKPVPVGNLLWYSFGEHIASITLTYCGCPGLIEVGVLPKPPMWDHHRILYPAAEPLQGPIPEPQILHDVIRNCDVEMFDLTDED